MITVSTIAMAACLVSSGITPQRAAPDSADVVSVVSRFHAALASSDSAGALDLLATDAIILESGSSETREHYRSHHLPADVAFARAVPSIQSLVRVYIQDDFAWIASTTVSKGQFAGRRINSAGAELMVLRREGAKWKIHAIHWSSAARRVSAADK